jgi:hypothetical protein
MVKKPVKDKEPIIGRFTFTGRIWKRIWRAKNPHSLWWAFCCSSHGGYHQETSMKYNQKKVKKHISVLQVFGFISCTLFVGLLITIKILYGSQFHNFTDFLSFLGLLILMSLLALPIVFLVHWFISLKYDLDEDVYDLAWNDGMRDQVDNKK